MVKLKIHFKPGTDQGLAVRHLEGMGMYVENVLTRKDDSLSIAEVNLRREVSNLGHYRDYIVRSSPMILTVSEVCL
jgi:hypothetical protein